MDRADIKFPTGRITGIIGDHTTVSTAALRMLVQQIRLIWPGDRREEEDRRNPETYGQRINDPIDDKQSTGRRTQTRRDNPNYVPPVPENTGPDATIGFDVE